MKQLVIKGFVFLICVFLTISAVIGCILYNHKQNNKLENLKYNQTELLSSTISKNGKSKMDFYLSDGGSLSSDGVKGVYTNMATGKEKVIFFAYPCNDVTYEWISNKKIDIRYIDRYEGSENNIVLDVTKDTYDSRKSYKGVN